MHLRVRQQLGGAQNLAVIELAQRLVGQRDLGHSEATKMRARFRQSRDHLRGDGFEYGVGRWSQHSKENTFVHRYVPLRSGLSPVDEIGMVYTTCVLAITPSAGVRGLEKSNSFWASTWDASASTLASANRGPTICRPIGNPLPSRPQGTEHAGR